MQRATLEKVVTFLILLVGLALLGPYFGLSIGANKQIEPETVSEPDDTMHSESHITAKSAKPSSEATKSNPLSEIDDLLK